jgi:hypothetical protein
MAGGKDAQATGSRRVAASVSTALGRTTAQQVQHLSSSAERCAVTEATDLQTVTQTRTDGTRTSTDADGTATNPTQGPDPRFEMEAPVSNRHRLLASARPSMSAAVKWRRTGRIIPSCAHARIPHGLSTAGRSALGAPMKRAIPIGPQAHRGPVVDNPTAAFAWVIAWWATPKSMLVASTERSAASVLARAEACGPASKGRHLRGCLAPPSIRVGGVSFTVHQILYSLGTGPRWTNAPSEDRLAGRARAMRVELFVHLSGAHRGAPDPGIRVTC